MDVSEKLLMYALEAINEANLSDDYWAIGGGTVLKMIYNHRESKDIDIFIKDPQLLNRLSPKLNDATCAAADYNEMANYISLTYPEGKVDFIVAGQITQFKPSKKDFYNHNVFTEDPVEIICKKMFYRGNAALPRDIFDLAIVYNSSRKSDLIKSCLKIEEQFKIFSKTFKKIYALPRYSDRYSDMIREGGFKIKGKENQICKKFISLVNSNMICR